MNREKYVGTQVSPDVHYRLAVLAAQKEMPLKELVRRILEEYIKTVKV